MTRAELIAALRVGPTNAAMVREVAADMLDADGRHHAELHAAVDAITAERDHLLTLVREIVEGVGDYHPFGTLLWDRMQRVVNDHG